MGIKESKEARDIKILRILVEKLRERMAVNSHRAKIARELIERIEFDASTSLNEADWILATTKPAETEKPNEK